MTVQNKEEAVIKLNQLSDKIEELTKEMHSLCQEFDISIIEAYPIDTM